MDDRANADALAARRFWIIQAMRIAGVVMVVAGLAVLQGKLALPDVAGWVLIGLGLIEAFVTPQLLARAWRSDREQ